jgi:MFS family permease
VGAYIRNCALETAEFLDSSRHVQAADQQHILHQLWNYRWAFVAVICLSGFTYATYEIAFIFLNSFSPLVSKTTKLEAISLNTLLLLGDMLLLPLFGWMADRIAPARMMCAAAAAAFIGAIPLFQMCIGADLWMLGIIRAYWVLVGVVFCAPFHLSIQQLVPAHCRYTLLSLGYAIGSQLFGGPFTAVALWLFHRYPTPLAPALYVMAISLMTMVATCYRPAFKLSSAGCPVAAVKSA